MTKEEKYAQTLEERIIKLENKLYDMSARTALLASLKKNSEIYNELETEYNFIDLHLKDRIEFFPLENGSIGFKL